MFFELTELLSCPACGPDHGLVLLVEEARDRRVYRGWLGCSSCGGDYRVRAGVADLRLGDEHASTPMPTFEESELAIKAAALSGVTEGPGYVLLTERLRHIAGDLADLLAGIEVIALGLGPGESEERHGVSRVLFDSGVPVMRYRVKAAVGALRDSNSEVEDLAGTVVPGGRLVLFDAGELDLERLAELGFELLAREGGTSVARRKGYAAVAPQG